MVPKGTVNAVGVEDCRQFFDHAPIPVQCLAPDGTVLHANQALLDFLGYAHADYVGLHVSEVHADPEVVADILSVLAKRDRLTDCSARLQCQDGSIREVLINSHAYWKGDQFAHTHYFIREITQEHRSEVIYSKVFRISRDSMSIDTLDDGRILDVNDACERLTGLQRQDMIGKTTLELGQWLRPEDREEYVRLLRRDRQREGFQGRHLCQGGGSRRPALGRSHRVPRRTVCARRCERPHGSQAGRGGLARIGGGTAAGTQAGGGGRLAGGVAHDFNNLLSIVVGHSAMLMSGLAAQDPLRTHVAAISRAADRATTLTQQLLAFSRRDIVRPRVLNLNDTVTQIQQLLPRLIGESIRVVITLDSALANIRADPNQVEHVLMNLAVNARDAMPQGGTLYLATTNTVFDAAAVRAHPGAQPGPYVTVSVRDTGQGMDAAAAAQVFEPFYTTKARGKGTGLGLATVYGIVKQAGGYIDLETASGRGSTFTVYFPQVDAVEDPIESAPSATGPVTGTETVLVVEDEDEVRALFREPGLTALGYTVLTACDGPSALEICGDDVSIDVVLTDVVMPGMSGSELSGHLTERYPGAEDDLHIRVCRRHP